MSRIFATLIGVVLLGSGLLKAIDSRTFSRQVAKYRLIPSRLHPAAVTLIIALECALATALILSFAPAIVLPLTAIVLVALAALTFWAGRQERIEDCGCYGGVVLLTPLQSVVVDGVYLVMTIAAWLMLSSTPSGQAGRALVVLAAALIAGWLSTRSREKPLIDLTRLQRGRRFKKSWITNTNDDLQTGSHFIVFLSKDCPWCKRWVPLMNILDTQPDLPKVTGVMSLGDGDVADFRRMHLVRFPIARMERKLASAMLHAYPTAALVENGIIVDKWEGMMPEEYLQRLQRFFEGIAPAETKQRRFAG
jgi:hypothetical protein